MLLLYDKVISYAVSLAFILISWLLNCMIEKLSGPVNTVGIPFIRHFAIHNPPLIMSFGAIMLTSFTFSPCIKTISTWPMKLSDNFRTFLCCFFSYFL